MSSFSLVFVPSLLLVSFLLIPGSLGCDIVVGDGVSDSGVVPFTSMEWLNNIISAWYSVNDEQVHAIVKEVLEEELNQSTPDLIEKITLEECTFGSDTPEIRGIKSRIVDLPSCDTGAKQKKLVLDIAFGIDAPDFEFKMGVKVAMTFITLRAAVQKLLLAGNIRVTALFSDQVPFPGIQNLCITFTSRPQVGFNVELLDAIDLDVFGVDSIITNVLDDILAKQLVYPGRLFVDLSQLGVGGPVKTIMMPRTDSQHPGVASMQISVVKQHPGNQGLNEVDFSASLGDDQEVNDVIAVRNTETVVTKHFLIKDFDNDEFTVEVYKDKTLAKDTQLGAVKVCLSDMEFSLPNVTEEFLHDNFNMRIKIRVRASLLPLIAVQQKGKDVTDHKKDFSGIFCDDGDVNEFDRGVLYVHVHGATSVPKKDSNSASDPYVIVSYNEKEILKTEPADDSANPIFNSLTEFIVTDFYQGSKLDFKMFDKDTWPNGDDFIGRVSLSLGEEPKRIVNQGLPLLNQDSSPTSASLYVSIIFRPLDLI